MSSAEKLARKALLSIEWVQNGGGTFSCQGCGGWTFRPIHNSDCLVDLALSALGLKTAQARIQEKERLDLYAPERLANWQ
jgi:hypothetical protein